MHDLNLRFAGRRFVVLVAFFILLSTTSTPVDAATPSAKIKSSPVLLYGDSIGVEVTPYLRRSIRRTLDTDLISRAFFGYNACDWHDQAKIDSQQYAPKFVIIVFVGNYLTPCMTANGASPSPKQITQVTTRYIKQLIANFPKSTIILTGFGRSIDQELIRAQTHSVTFTDVLNQSLFQLARRTDNRYVSVARSLYNSKGKAKRFLPCSKETDGNLCPRSRKVAVRSPDGLHLCPVAYTINEAGVTAPCRVAIPGAARVAADIMRVLTSVR